MHFFQSSDIQTHKHSAVFLMSHYKHVKQCGRMIYICN